MLLFQAVHLEEVGMSETLTFDNLLKAFHQLLERLPDRRTGKNTRYTIKDAALGAFAVFFTQSPSFLAYQRTMKQSKGRSNAESLFGIEHIPCDNQIRTLLDPLAPCHLFSMFTTVFEALEQCGELDPFRVLEGNLLVSLDGTQYFSSKKIHCCCSVNRIPSIARRSTASSHGCKGSVVLSVWSVLIANAVVVRSPSLA